MISLDPRDFIRSFNNTKTYRVIILIIHIFVGLFYIGLMYDTIKATNANETTVGIPIGVAQFLGVLGVGLIIYHALAAWTRLTTPKTFS